MIICSWKSSTSKRDTSEIRHTTLFVALWIMWQGQPFIYIYKFTNTRAMMEFFFLTFNAVLPSSTATQFSQPSIFSLRIELMLLKSTSAVPSLDGAIYKSWTETFPLLSSNKRIKTGFNFFMPVSSFDPSVPSESCSIFNCWMSSDLK